MSTDVVRKVFAYDGNDVTFARKDGVTMVNATQMAKKFSKLPADWTRQKSTKEFISALMTARGIHIATDLLRVINGDKGATWMHEDVALEFARWLSPAFAIWCNDRIKELMKFGMTATQPTLEAMLDNPDLIIGLATKLKQQREENQRLVAENQQKQALISQQNEKIEKDAPKVDYFEKFMTAEHGDTNAGIREVVKQAHIKSEKRFIGWMIQKQILFRQKKDNRLQPYADYAKCFDYKDVHDTNNDWSGKHLKFNPYGKLHIVKKYHEQHPEEFEDTKDLFNQ
jgi:phage antirepressor YoqD-like protein